MVETAFVLGPSTEICRAAILRAPAPGPATSKTGAHDPSRALAGLNRSLFGNFEAHFVTALSVRLW